MTRTKRRIITLLLWPLTLAIALAATARPPSAPPPGGPGGHEGCPFSGPPPFDRVLERHADRLGLDEAQLEKIDEMANEARPEMESLHSALAARHDELHELLSQDEPDEAEVIAQAERVGEAETALRKLRILTMLRVRALLTPEQRAELVKIHEERREHFGRKHFGKRGEGRHGWKRCGPGDGPPDATSETEPDVQAPPQAGGAESP